MSVNISAIRISRDQRIKCDFLIEIDPDSRDFELDNLSAETVKPDWIK